MQRRFPLLSGMIQMAHKRGLVSLIVDWTSKNTERSLAHAVATRRMDAT